MVMLLGIAAPRPAMAANPVDAILNVANEVGMFIVRTEENVQNNGYRTQMQERYDKTVGKLESVNQMTSTFSGAYTMLQGVGILLAGVNIYVMLIRELQRTEANMTLWTRVFVSMGLSFAVILNIDVIFDAIGAAANVVYEVTKNELVKENGIMDQALANRTELVVQAWNEQTVGEKLGVLIDASKDAANYLLQSGVMWVTNIMINCGMDTLIYALGIRMVLRRMFAPIAVADIASEGFRSPGVRYLKRYAAYYIEEAIILLASVIYIVMSAIVSQTTATTNPEAVTGFTSQIWVQIALRGALMTVMASANEIAREIMGE